MVPGWKLKALCKFLDALCIFYDASYTIQTEGRTVQFSLFTQPLQKPSNSAITSLSADFEKNDQFLIQKYQSGTPLCDSAEWMWLIVVVN